MTELDTSAEVLTTDRGVIVVLAVDEWATEAGELMLFGNGGSELIRFAEGSWVAVGRPGAVEK